MSAQLVGIINSIAAIVVVFGLCLLCHEAGHFAIAKLFNMKVEEFAFGFGRALWRRTRGETTYRLNIFPYGAYVRIAGMEPGAEAVERGFHSRPRWQGALVLAAGSAANLVLAAILFAAVVSWVGVDDRSDPNIYVGRTTPGSPAAAAGLASGDRIVAMDGQTKSLRIESVAPGSLGERLKLKPGEAIKAANGTEVVVPSDLLRALRGAGTRKSHISVEGRPTAEELIPAQRGLDIAFGPALAGTPPDQAAAVLEKTLGVQFQRLTQGSLVDYVGNRLGVPIDIQVERDGRLLTLRPVTEVANARYAYRDVNGMVYSRFRQVGRIGLVMRSARRAVTPGESIMLGLIMTRESALTVVHGLRAMLARDVEAELAGPVAIMAISAERAQVGWDAVLNWGGLISAILAIMNLFPLPPFDGFRIVLLGIEAVLRRRVDPQKELVVSLAGFIVMVFFFVVLTFKDIANLVRFGTP